LTCERPTGENRRDLILLKEKKGRARCRAAGRFHHGIAALFCAASAAVLVLFLVPFSSPAVGEGVTGRAREFLETEYGRLAAMLEKEPAGGADAIIDEVADLIRKTFDLDLFSYGILPERLSEFSAEENREFQEALSIALAQAIPAFIRGGGGEGVPSLEFVSRKTSGPLPVGTEAAVILQREMNRSWRMRGAQKKAPSHILLRYSLKGAASTRPLFFALESYPDGSFKITDIFSSGVGLVNQYSAQARETLQRYSLPYLLAELRGSNHVVLEDWSEGKVGKIPFHWRSRDNDSGKRRPYAIREEEDMRYLAADDRGESVVLGKEVRWNLRKYPYLSFRWRARLLPENGDERLGSTNDSAAAVTVIFKVKYGVIPFSVKYVWSSTLPVGAAVRREGIGKPWVVVADSGGESLGEWRSHIFNVYEAYRKTYGGDPPEGTVGIAILTDANATLSAASADYGEIRALREADAGSGVREILPPL
jgi:hypothetical protein